MIDQSHNAADPEAVAKQQEKIKAQRVQDLEDIRQLLSTIYGIRFFRRMVRDGRVFSTSMTGDTWTYFNEGARNLVNRYLADVSSVSPDKINLLLSNEKEKR
jgi:hypothetical protein